MKSGKLLTAILTLAVCLLINISTKAEDTCKFKVDKLISSEITSRVAKTGKQVVYDYKVRNNQPIAQTYLFSIVKPRELACSTILADTLKTIQPGQCYSGKLTVTMSNRIPVGAYETCILEVKSADGKEKEVQEFITVNPKPHPYLLVTDQLINNAIKKVKERDWAKQNLEDLVNYAEEYKVPERKLIDGGRLLRRWKAFAYKANTTEDLFHVALAWKLTGNKAYLAKVLKLVRDICDTEEGYISTGHATTGVQVHEGYFFSFLAAICDILYAEDVFSNVDKENIEKTMRHYLRLNRDDMTSIGIMNHEASANVGSVLVSLFLQDMVELNHFVESPGGLADQISKGTMGDGWWFEGTPGYCSLVVARLTYAAVAFENYGLDIFNRRFPFKYKSKDFDNAKEGFTGMKYDIWGPPGKSTRGFEEMYLAYIPMMDQDANLAANNDGKLTAPSPFYEIAYNYFLQDEVAWVISRSNRDSWEALIYGVGELPKVEDPRTSSATLPNVGLTALRSNPKVNSSEEQIQAYQKFGTHGGWHGQFDRTGMIALDRYGHNYFGTEMVWFGYGDAGYKECVQTSAMHNMVVVDELQQEAVPSEQLLFYAGNIMQVSAVQTVARWREIPRFNIEKYPPWDDKDYAPGFEPVLQRRLMVVTDDYVVIADYMKAPQNHTYDWLLHPIGFNGIEGAKKSGQVLETVSKDGYSPYKFFTNGQWYKIKKGAKLHFDDNGMKLDVHTLWPRKADVLVANYPVGGKRSGMRNNPDRRTYGVRSKGKEMIFLNVLEPYKGESKIQKIESINHGELSVTLSNDRVQKITLSNLKGEGNNIQVEIEEFEKGKVIRSEKSNSIEN